MLIKTFERIIFIVKILYKKFTYAQVVNKMCISKSYSHIIPVQIISYTILSKMWTIYNSYPQVFIYYGLKCR